MKFKKIWFRFHVDWFLYHFYNAFKFVVDLVRKLARSTCNTLCNNNLQAGLRSVGWNITTLKRIDVFKTKNCKLIGLKFNKNGWKFKLHMKKKSKLCCKLIHTCVWKEVFLNSTQSPLSLHAHFQLKLIVERNILGNICIFYPW